MSKFFLAVVEDDPSSYSPTLEPLSGVLHETEEEALEEINEYFKGFDMDEPSDDAGHWQIWRLEVPKK